MGETFLKNNWIEDCLVTQKSKLNQTDKHKTIQSDVEE